MQSFFSNNSGAFRFTDLLYATLQVWLTLADHYLHSIAIDWDKTMRFTFNERSNPDDDSMGIQIVKVMLPNLASCSDAAKRTQRVKHLLDRGSDDLYLQDWMSTFICFFTHPSVAFVWRVWCLAFINLNVASRQKMGMSFRLCSTDLILLTEALYFPVV